MRARVALIIAVVVLLGLGWLFRLHRPVAGAPAQPPRGAELLPGGDGGGLPRSTLSAEHMDADAVERAAQDPSAAGLRALVIARDGHLVYERYGDALSGDTLIDGGGFARVLLAMASGVAVSEGILAPSVTGRFDPDALRTAIEAGSRQTYAAYLSHRIWSRLNAHAAWIVHAPGTPVPADCCLKARVLDWMRVGLLLAGDGRFEGKELVPTAWLQRMQRPLSLDSLQGYGIELAAAAHGAEPFAMRGAYFLRGPGHWRLWVVPPLRLAVLFGADAPAAISGAPWDETRLPNAIIRAVSDRPVEPGDVSQLQRLVPGH